MMHEDELRRVLQDLEAPDGVSASQLSEQVIRRGRTIKRQQTALTAMVIAGIAASAIGLANMLPGQQNAVPAQQVPSPSASATPDVEEDAINENLPEEESLEGSTPSRTPDASAQDSQQSGATSGPEPKRQAPEPRRAEPQRPETNSKAPEESSRAASEPPTSASTDTAEVSQPDASSRPERRPVSDPDATKTAEETLPKPPVVWHDSTVLPDDVGDLGSYRLAGESFQGDEVTTPYEPIGPSVSMCRTTSIPEITKIVAGRSRMSYGPNYSDTESILVFATEEDAANFMAASRREQEACARDGLGDGGEQPSDYELMLSTRSL